MPIKETKLSSGFVEIEYFDMTSSEEIEWFKRLNGVASFPSANQCSKTQKKELEKLQEDSSTSGN